MAEMICFHNPDEPHGHLSNWHLSRFEMDGVAYSSLEQWMMHQKALVFGDGQTARRIMATDDPATIKALGRAVTPFDSTVWGGRSQIVVYRGLLAKFGQDGKLRRELDETGDAMLVECSRDDVIWACGLAMDDPRRLDIAQWRGRNLLGFAMMEVRERLRERR